MSPFRLRLPRALGAAVDSLTLSPVTSDTAARVGMLVSTSLRVIVSSYQSRVLRMEYREAFCMQYAVQQSWLL